jgi:hypothetical protein
MLQPGFSLTQDTEGYKFPTSIVFVPSPGPDPKDPLYFVAELRGTIKVVTNDRSVYIFSNNFFKSSPPKELPAPQGAVGLFGLCLAPEQGFLYATFARLGEDGLFENGMIRFATTPRVFSIRPQSRVDFSPAFLSPRSRFGVPLGHQIGACHVYDDQVFISVGDGEIPGKAQDLDSTLGKILRMTLDGRPVPQNPFYTNDGVDEDNDFIWAYGFRNPFGHIVVNGRVFVADNGPQPDRFLEAIEGGNYLYDGSDISVATNSIVVFLKGRGLGHVAYAGMGAKFLPERLWSSFFVVLSGAPEVLIKDERPEIIALQYRFDDHLLLRRPETLLRYNGKKNQNLAAISLGPDGLYFAPVLPEETGTTAVYKLAYNEGSNYPSLITEDLEPRALMSEYGCLGCHRIGEQGANRVPSLNPKDLVERVERKLNSAMYAQRVRALSGSKDARYVKYATARQEVMEADGRERVKRWLIYRVIEPRFDDPEATMPNLGVSYAEAEAIADYLLAGANTWTVRAMVADLFPRPRKQHLAYFFLAGLVSGGGIAVAAIGIVRVTKRWRRVDHKA